MRTFTGGVHVPEFKELTEHKASVRLPIPPEIIIPMQMHLGAPCKPLVEKGGKVKIGQKVGEPGGFISAPIHSSVSGTVTHVEPRPHPSGNEVLSIVIKPDEEQNDLELLSETSSDPTQDEIRKIVAEAGLVGLGGAGFPTHVKVADIPDLPIDTVIINGCECEPYLTSDTRVMLEMPDELIDGMKLLLAAVGAKRGVIGVEENKPECIKVMREKAQAFNSSAGSGGPTLEVVELLTKYPQGSEKQLINVVTGKEVPSGLLPRDVGALVQNVMTAVTVSRAVRKRMPIVERIVTVTGAVGQPQNLLVKVGTPIKYLIEAAGGITAERPKVIMGGPMMGAAQSSMDVPITKTSGGIVVLNGESDSEPEQCIRCARCVDVCPIGLLPLRFALYSSNEAWEDLKTYGISDCIECGSCSYTCPSRIQIVQWIRLGKTMLRKKAQG